MTSFLEWMRRHRSARWGLSGLSGLLALVAVGLLAYPSLTNLFQSQFEEGHLSQQLSSPRTRQDYLNNRLADGESLTRIKIPAIGLDVVVVQGTTEQALRAGAGHYPTTPLPCTVGNVAIAGHRTTYGKPFANVNELKPGDSIELDTPVGSCRYAVTQDPFRVLPTDVSVLADTPGQYTLTLTSCAPRGYATHRIIIKATMVSSSPSPTGPSKASAA